MSFDPVFAGAYIDNGRRHRILGCRLRPFCLWHLFQLQIVDSPFIRSGEVKLYHLRRAIGICRLQFPDSFTRLPYLCFLWKAPNFRKEVQRFLLYMADYLSKPEWTIIPMNEFPSRGQRALPRIHGPPDPVQVAFDAAAGANISLKDAWNMPLAQAYVAQAMHFRRQGLLVDFMTEDDRNFQQALKEKLNSNGAKK